MKKINVLKTTRQGLFVLAAILIIVLLVKYTWFTITNFQMREIYAVLNSTVSIVLLTLPALFAVFMLKNKNVYSLIFGALSFLILLMLLIVPNTGVAPSLAHLNKQIWNVDNTFIVIENILVALLFVLSLTNLVILIFDLLKRKKSS